ncbi:hypothetical protein [Candidatus Poriferisodalis sp.]|uniref:hypothetical protein n=1 Tax=Candidatus Poriferisodalis sp. TaxID=3101277 RepID=UPI003B0147E6
MLLEEDIFPDADFISLNAGVGYGYLRVMSPEERPNPRDVVIYETLPNDLPRVAGIITAVLGTLDFPDGTVHGGFAVPFYFYDEFMKNAALAEETLFGKKKWPAADKFTLPAGTKLSAVVTKMLAHPRFRADYEIQDEMLDDLRDAIKDAQMSQLRRHLAVVHNRFAELYEPEPGEAFAMEIEFKITSANLLAIKQARPWVFAAASTGGQGETPNQAPTVSAAIADAAIVNQTGTKSVSLAGVFSDADGSRVSSQFDITVTITPPGTATESGLPPIVARYDANNDGAIDTAEYQQVKSDWLAGEISYDQFLEIVRVNLRSG